MRKTPIVLKNVRISRTFIPNYGLVFIFGEWGATALLSDDNYARINRELGNGSHKKQVVIMAGKIHSYK